MYIYNIQKDLAKPTPYLQKKYFNFPSAACLTALRIVLIMSWKSETPIMATAGVMVSGVMYLKGKSINCYSKGTIKV